MILAAHGAKLEGNAWESRAVGLARIPSPDATTISFLDDFGTRLGCMGHVFFLNSIRVNTSKKIFSAC